LTGLAKYLEILERLKWQILISASAKFIIVSFSVTIRAYLRRPVMLISGTCPKCGKEITRALVKAIPVSTSIIAGIEYRGVSYMCPSCRCVLGISMDPIAEQAELLSKIKKMISDILDR